MLHRVTLHRIYLDVKIEFYSYNKMSNSESNVEEIRLPESNVKEIQLNNIEIFNFNEIDKCEISNELKNYIKLCSVKYYEKTDKKKDENTYYKNTTIDLKIGKVEIIDEIIFAGITIPKHIEMTINIPIIGEQKLVLNGTSGKVRINREFLGKEIAWFQAWVEGKELYYEGHVNFPSWHIGPYSIHVPL